MPLQPSFSLLDDQVRYNKTAHCRWLCPFGTLLKLPQKSQSSLTACCGLQLPLRFVTAMVASFNVSPNGLSRNVTTHFCVIGSASHVKKDSSFFRPLTLWSISCDLKQKSNPLSIQYCICDCLVSHKGSKWYPSRPPSFLAGQYLLRRIKNFIEAFSLNLLNSWPNCWYLIKEAVSAKASSTFVLL